MGGAQVMPFGYYRGDPIVSWGGGRGDQGKWADPCGVKTGS